MSIHKQKSLTAAILAWYKKNGRHELPWRQTTNPYHILVSEIMLQQTQVTRVITKYQEFLAAFPTLETLATAKTSAVITAWKGLGYNRRALFLQKTAKAVVEDHAGIFPQDLETLKTLPGVGDYTARAVLSFAFDVKTPMMDTNHRRVYRRTLLGRKEISDKELLPHAEKLVKVIKQRAWKGHSVVYHWNQALMDLGSHFCTTRNPKCEECPAKAWCKAYPDILTKGDILKPNQKKKSIRFEDTDRYVRGRMIDLLRDKGRVSFPTLRKKFAQVEVKRYRNILEKLEKDGLIKREGNGMVLPE